MPKLSGRVFVKADGQSLPSKEGASLTYAPGNIQRASATSDRGVEGFVESIVAPTVEAEFVDSAAFDIESLFNKVDFTLTFQVDSGKSFVLRQAFATGAPSFSGGAWKVSFSAVSCSQV